MNGNHAYVIAVLTEQGKEKTPGGEENKELIDARYVPRAPARETRHGKPLRKVAGRLSRSSSAARRRLLSATPPERPSCRSETRSLLRPALRVASRRRRRPPAADGYAQASGTARRRKHARGAGVSQKTRCRSSTTPREQRMPRIVKAGGATRDRACPRSTDPRRRHGGRCRTA